jgi:methanogenic corrinoid protein MtbC1
MSPGTADPAAEISPACLLYVAASIRGRRDRALAIVREALDEAESPLDVYLDIFQDALYEVGRRWERAGLTIAEEHMATATTQYILSVLQQELPRSNEHRGTAVVAGILGEHHAVGVTIVADLLDADGWSVRFLGTNLPHDPIVSAVSDQRASLLAISVTMSERLLDVRDLIALVRTSVPEPPRIIVGGAAFRGDPKLWRSVGADGSAPDARGVTDLARG